MHERWAVKAAAGSCGWWCQAVGEGGGREQKKEARPGQAARKTTVEVRTQRAACQRRGQASAAAADECAASRYMSLRRGATVRRAADGMRLTEKKRKASSGDDPSKEAWEGRDRNSNRSSTSRQGTGLLPALGGPLISPPSPPSVRPQSQPMPVARPWIGC